MTDAAALEALLREPTALVLKHGRTCPISAAAREELAAFVDAHPDATVYALEVTEHRPLSDRLAERLRVAHESPQAIVVRDGRAVWHAEHFDITARALADALDA